MVDRTVKYCAWAI